MSRSIIAAIIFAVVLLILAVAGPAACNKIRSLGDQNRVTTGQAGAAKDSATDAIGTQGKANVRERESGELDRANEKEIRNAKGANAAVDPAVRDAGLASLCRRAVYRDHPKCRMRGAPAR